MKSPLLRPSRSNLTAARPSRARERQLPRITSSATLALALACGQKAPPEETGPTDYYPLVDGASWVYEHDDWTEQVTVESTTFEGQPAFLMSDSPNPGDQMRSDAILTRVDGRVARVTKEEYFIPAAGDPMLVASVTYGVGFTRFDENWATQAPGYSETPEYVRIETRPDGTVRPEQARKHTYEVISLSDEQVTAAGTFNCIQIQRTRDWEAEADGLDVSEAQTKMYWFARGVGKVRELTIDSGNSESLVAYDIPSEP